MAEGLRERKKRRTRQHLSDVATGLFVERGFDAVTIAEIAEAADVSVNTVYNYFPAKEDLFLDRSSGVVDRLSRYVRGRDKGSPQPTPSCANCGVRRRVSRRPSDSSPGTRASCGSSRALTPSRPASGTSGRRRSSIWRGPCARRRGRGRTTGLRSWWPVSSPGCTARSWRTSEARWSCGRGTNEVSRDALVLLDDMEDLLGEQVLNYARRAAA